MTPPYYAVIFTSQRSAQVDGYDDTAERMAELAAAAGLSRQWTVRAAPMAWASPCPTGARWKTSPPGAGRPSTSWRGGRGRAEWYRRYELRISKVERAYGWARDDGLNDPAAP